MSKKIIVRKVDRYNYTITADGKVRDGFSGLADCAEWFGAMQAHGLFPGYEMYVESDTGHLTPVEPTYENPFAAPIICQFG